MKPAPKEFQMKYIQGDLLKLKNEMQQNFNILQKYPISLIPFSDVLQILNAHHIKFIDFEFPPMEVSYLEIIYVYIFKIFICRKVYSALILTLTH